MQPFAWEGLKRALTRREIRIESLGQMYSLVSTVSLEPEPIPLRRQDRPVRRALPATTCSQAYDPEFSELFKVAADFDDEFERTPENEALYARLLATRRAARRSAAARPRCGGARRSTSARAVAGDSTKLSANLRRVVDLLSEADFLARQAGRAAVGAEDVRTAHRGAASPRRPAARAGARGDPARHGHDRHRRREDRPGQRPVGVRARRLRVRRAHAHHCDHAARRGPGDRHPARSASSAARSIPRAC